MYYDYYGEKSSVVQLGELLVVLSSLGMGNDLRKIPKVQRKHLVFDCSLMLPQTFLTTTSASIFALSIHLVDLLMIFENSVIFIVLSSSKTLMVPYCRAKFLCLAFKAFKKIGPPSQPHIRIYPKTNQPLGHDRLLASSSVSRSSWYPVLMMSLSLLCKLFFLSLCFLNYTNLSKLILFFLFKSVREMLKSLILKNRQSETKSKPYL